VYPGRFEFEPVEGRPVMAAFDGGTVTSDAGALSPGRADRSIGLARRLAGCFTDKRSAERTEHRLPAMVGQRVFAIAPGSAAVSRFSGVNHLEGRPGRGSILEPTFGRNRFGGTPR
jgi:hypothetical protein